MASTTDQVTIALGADNAGADLKNALKAQLQADPRVRNVIDFGVPDTQDTTAYPHVGLDVAQAVARGDARRGLLVCGTGIGMAITANKVPGIRAALTHDTYSAERAAKSNNAQIITMGARVIGPELAKAIVDTWLASEFDPKGASAANVEAINKLDETAGKL